MLSSIATRLARIGPEKLANGAYEIWTEPPAPSCAMYVSLLAFASPRISILRSYANSKMQVSTT